MTGDGNFSVTRVSRGGPVTRHPSRPRHASPVTSPSPVTSTSRVTRHIHVTRHASRSLLFLAALSIACSGDAPKQVAETTPPPPKLAPDGPTDLSGLKANIPKATLDTFTPLANLKVEKIPDAPSALMDAAEREEGISRFCYQEYGQKADPKLVGAVALVVTVDGNVIQGARVGADDWSSKAGAAVNRCLVQKVAQAWKLLPGERVPAGKYVVQLRFRPS